MHQNIGKLLPVDGFKVVIQGELRLNYQLSLTHFYQPLIGMEAVSLYQTLVTESVIHDGEDTLHSHHTLMNYMALPLDKIYQARLKLEGIGLVRVFKEEGTNGDSYLYKLIPPFSPIDFLEDGMLSQLLLHNLGEKKFNELNERFKKQGREINHEITAGFNEVFSTNEATFKHTEVTLHPRKKDNTVHNGPNIDVGNIDLEWLKRALQKRMIEPGTILTASNTKLIAQMAVLYELASHDLENAIMWAIDENHRLNPNEFKSACHDLSFAGRDGGKVHLNEKLLAEEAQEEPNHNTGMGKDTGNKESQFIHMLETISPKHLLEDLSGGNKASEQDLKMIRDIMSQQGLSAGVMNVLVHYVLLKTDMKLSKAYMEKIASHWSRKKVKTVKQAMQMAKAENTKYQQWGKSNFQPYSKANSKEVIPDWFKERKKKNQEAEKKKVISDKETDDEDISEMIQNYLKNKESNHL